MTPRTGLYVLGVLMLGCVGATWWVRLNVSPSAPYGLYWLRAVQGPVPRGAMVVLPVPVSVRPWHSRWMPLLKPVAAVPGDTVCRLGDRVVVNGVEYGPVYAEAHGRRLPQMEAGCQVIAAERVFLASPAPRSLDSRYFGAVPVRMLTARAVPLVTWR